MSSFVSITARLCSVPPPNILQAAPVVYEGEKEIKLQHTAHSSISEFISEIFSVKPKSRKCEMQDREKKIEE